MMGYIKVTLALENLQVIWGNGTTPTYHVILTRDNKTMNYYTIKAEEFQF